MAAKADESNDFYAVLGLKKECTATELRHAYKKLALKWHPDRSSASRDCKLVEEAKRRFQAIQQAYSVLSDGNKRFLYDVGVYDCNDDDDENGMGDFLNEMAAMMTQTKPDGNGNETFEELQDLFDEMFHSDIEPFGSATPPSSCYSSSQGSCIESYGVSGERNSAELSSGNSRAEFAGFCIGASESGGESSRRKNSRKGRRW